MKTSARSLAGGCAAAAVLALAASAHGQATTQPAAGTMGGTMPPGATAAVAAPDLGSPKAAVKAFVTAQINGDGKTIRQTLLTNNPTEERMAGAIADLAVAIADLNRAMVAKFGPAPTQQLMGDPADAMQANVAKIDKATEHVTGDTATVVSPPETGALPPGAPPATAPTADNPTGSPQESMLLKKDGGQWKISVSDLSKGNNDENIRKTLASVDTAVAGYRSVLSDLNGGRLISVEAVAAELNAKMTGPGGTPPAGTTPGTGAPGTTAMPVTPTPAPK